LLGPLGDLGGARTRWEEAGFSFSLTYIGEVLGNASGGVRRGTIYEGRLDAQFDLDLDKALGWSGATIHTNFYQIHGTGLSRYYLANLLVASGIEALPSTRLYELWFEQKLLEGKLAVRAGQLAADTEFLVSQYAGLFVNSTFGWPGITAANLPSGGPAYPLATPGIRLKMQPTDDVAILLGLFNGDPAPEGPGDPQRRNRTGTSFELDDPPLFIGEAQASYNQGKGASGLPGTVKLGAWHHFGRFSDQSRDVLGASLADPNGSGLAARLRGNDGVYAVLDQLVYRFAGDGDQGIGLFARASASPSDRNLISFYADGGVTFKGLLPSRPDDTFGISVGYAQISESVRRLDRENVLFSGEAQPIRSSEAVLEVTYQAQIVPGWTVQPDFQYVFRPGGNVVNPRDPNGGRIKDAAVFGVRSSIRY
jgi:porin